MMISNTAPKGNKISEKMIKTTRAKHKRPTRTWPFQTIIIIIIIIIIITIVVVVIVVVVVVVVISKLLRE